MTITVKEMRILEVNSEALGVPTRLLMENAGAAIARIIVEKLNIKKGNVVIFAGKGGNAGDGFVAARHLAHYGFMVKILLFYNIVEIKNKDALENLIILKRMDRSISITKSYLQSNQHVEADVLIDGLLGVGLKPPLREPIKSAIRMFNRSKGVKVAIDVPTGIDPDTGSRAEEYVKANYTITFHDIKPGLLKAKDATGEIIVANIGIPPEASVYVGPGDVIYEVPSKPKDAHKGIGGKVLIIGGSSLYSGAPALSALSALKAGADLAFVAAPETTAYIVASYSPNIIAIKLPCKNINVDCLKEVENNIVKKIDAVVIGPGLGLAKETYEAVFYIVNKLLSENKFLVIDADALKILAKSKIDLKKKAVLTPHIAELSLLLGEKRDAKTVEERIFVARETSKKYNATVLLKGSIDVIVENERIKLNKTGNPGMSVGGTGDTLTGIVATLLARGIEPFKAAYIAAFINGLAGDMVYSKQGERILPTDIINEIPGVFNKPFETYVETCDFKEL